MDDLGEHAGGAEIFAERLEAARADRGFFNELAARDPWDMPASSTRSPEGERVLIRVPARFSDMQAAEPSLAQAWRQQTRGLFTTCFAQGYRAVDFFRDDRAGGAYLLALLYLTVRHSMGIGLQALAKSTPPSHSASS